MGVFSTVAEGTFQNKRNRNNTACPCKVTCHTVHDDAPMSREGGASSGVRGQMVLGAVVVRAGRLHDGVGKLVQQPLLPTMDEDEPMMSDAIVWFGCTRSVLVVCCCVRFIAQVATFHEM
jgi:hypothetical protein